jgi:hypothetical protein
MHIISLGYRAMKLYNLFNLTTTKRRKIWLKTIRNIYVWVFFKALVS